jgi:hypothetical protein
MKRWIILPYDRSPVARAALRHAGRAVESGDAYSADAGVILVTAGVDPSDLDALLDEAQPIAGARVPLELRLLDPGDPIRSLHRIVASMPDAVLGAPLGGRGSAPWYAEACQVSGLDRTMMLFLISPHELREFEVVPHERRRLGSPVRALLRAGARLRPGVRAPLTGGPA